MYVRSEIQSIVQRIIYAYYNADVKEDIRSIDIFMLFTEYPSKTDRVLAELKKQDKYVYTFCSGMLYYSVHHRGL
jgi:hypothetical protein